MSEEIHAMETQDRSYLRFEQKVREAFSFLPDEGFEEVEAVPTLVRYRKGSIDLDVYHGRQSYEIGAGVTVGGTRYSVSEIIRATDVEAAKCYRQPVATTPEGVAAGLEELRLLIKRHGTAALHGDPPFLLRLKDLRTQWSQEYALEVLAAQLRPQAEDAFRRGDYSKAAELYGRIRNRLSPAEIKKLALAEGRRRS